jgi:hypothetical protein
MSFLRAVRPTTRLPGLIASLAVAIAFVWISGAVALAQAPSPGTSGAFAPAEVGPKAARPIPLGDVPDRAEATRAELDAIVPKDAPSLMLERIGSELDRTLPDIESLLATTRETLAARPGIRSLNESEAALSAMLERLRPWNDELDRQLAALRPALARLDAIAADWQATGEVARREGASTTTLNLIAAVRHEIDQVHAAVLTRRNQILAVLDRLVDPNASLSASLREVQSETKARLTGILRVDRPPLCACRRPGDTRASRRACSGFSSRSSWCSVSSCVRSASVREGGRRTSTSWEMPRRSSNVRGRFPW